MAPCNSANSHTSFREACLRVVALLFFVTFGCLGYDVHHRVKTTSRPEKKKKRKRTQCMHESASKNSKHRFFITTHEIDETMTTIKVRYILQTSL